MTLKAVFKSGDRFVLIDSEAEIDDHTPARVLDTANERLEVPMPLGSIMAHCPYFEAIDDQPEELSDKIALAEVEPPSDGFDIEDPME